MHILSFGEILWDIIKGKEFIGGAPFNLTVHLAKMGCKTSFISAVGSDSLGQKALEKALEYGIDTKFIKSHPHLPTGIVKVNLDSWGHPTFQIIENVAWDYIALSENAVRDLCKVKWDAFCFGTLAQRSSANREILYQLLVSIKPRHVFYDVNLRQNFYRKEWIEKSLCLSTIVKLNDHEATILSELLFSQNFKQKEFIEHFTKKYDLSIVCITHGKNGASVYHQNNLKKIPGINGPVVDSVGAGDGFSAGFLFAFLNGSDVYEAAEFAEIIGNFTVSKAGAIPEYPLWLKKEIKNIIKS